MVLFLAFCLGMGCGIRLFIPLAALGSGVALGWLPPTSGWLSLWNVPATPWLFTIAAVVEVIGDKLRFSLATMPALSLAFRLAGGALAGATAGAWADTAIVGLVGGLMGALAGSVLSRAVRREMAVMAGSDVPGALLEDAFVLVGVLFIIAALS